MVLFKYEYYPAVHFSSFTYQFTRSTIVVKALITLLVHSPTATSGNPISPLQSRQGTGISIIVGTVTPFIKAGLGGYSAPSCDDYGGNNAYYLNGNSSRSAPNAPLTYWQLCFTPGDHIFTQADADAAKCIIDLHTKSDDKCISVAGSTCDYTPPSIPLTKLPNSNPGMVGFLPSFTNVGTEKLLKGQIEWVGGGQSSEYVISVGDAANLKSAVDGFVGVGVDMADSGLGSEIDVYVMDGSDYKSTGMGLNSWGSNSKNHC